MSDNPPWVRFEDGRVTGLEPEDLPAKIRRAMKDAKSINWHLHDMTITVLD